MLKEYRKRKGISQEELERLVNIDRKTIFRIENDLNMPLLDTFAKMVIALDLTKNLKSITRPTLLIWGENDIDTPLYMAKIMEEQIPDARFSGFEGSNAFFVP